MANNVISFSARPQQPARLNPSRLKDARIATGFNQTELANVIGVSRQAISVFESGEKKPDPDTMSRIAAAVDQPISYFATEDAPSFGAFTPKFFRAVGAETKRRNSMCDVFGKWFSQTARYFFDLVTFPEVNVPSVTPSSGGRYTEEEIERAAEECRKMWGLGVGPISNVVGLLESNGVIVCRHEVAGQKIEAFSYWNGSRPFVFLASDKESAVRSRFDAAHELGHLVLHKWIEPDELEDTKALKEIESEANRFASALLMPRNSFPNEIYTPRLDAFVELKRRWKVAIQAMVCRCKDLGIFDEYQVTNLYKQISFRRWRTKEPLDDQIPFERPKLLKRASEAVINAGKKTGDEIAAELKISVALIASFCDLPKELFAKPNQTDFVPSLR